MAKPFKSEFDLMAEAYATVKYDKQRLINEDKAGRRVIGYPPQLIKEDVNNKIHQDASNGMEKAELEQAYGPAAVKAYIRWGHANDVFEGEPFEDAETAAGGNFKNSVVFQLEGPLSTGVNVLARDVNQAEAGLSDRHETEEANGMVLLSDDDGKGILFYNGRELDQTGLENALKAFDNEISDEDRDADPYRHAGMTATEAENRDADPYRHENAEDRLTELTEDQISALADQVTHIIKQLESSDNSAAEEALYNLSAQLRGY